MTLVPGVALTMLVLSAAGCLPVLGLVGFRFYAVALCPLAGAVLAAVAATCCLGLGASTMTWFVIVSVLGAAGTVAWWWWRPDRRPWRAPGAPGGPGDRVIALAGVVGVVGSLAWCLQTLSTPTVGFDTRAVWLMRAGWFLQPHHQLVVDMSSPGIFLSQTSYPPLVSAAGAVGWFVSGNHSMRLGVVVIALLNACAVAAATLAVVECGRRAGARLGQATPPAPPARGVPRSRSGVLGALPGLVGVAAAVALVFTTFAVAEPFMTNGYADPLWSLAAVGAVAYGLQTAADRSALGAAAILVVVAGMSKDEGAVTAAVLIVVLVVRRLAAAGAERRRQWWRPVAAGSAGLVILAAWPATVRLLHLRAVAAGGSPRSAYLHRAHQAVSGLAPYLHVLAFALGVAAVGWLVLRPVRRAAGIGNDAWSWAGLAAGAAVILGAYVTGSADVPSWLTTTAHRVTEFPALGAWWIVAVWAVTAAAAPAYGRGPAVRATPARASVAGPDTDDGAGGAPAARHRDGAIVRKRNGHERSNVRDRTVERTTKGD